MPDHQTSDSGRPETRPFFAATPRGALLLLSAAVLAAWAARLGRSLWMDEALTFSLAALAWQPADAKMHYNIGNIYIYKGRIDEAIGRFQEAVRLAPDYSRAHNNLGSALMLRSRIDEAIHHFREAVRLDPDYGMARENLEDALAQKKKLGR